MLTSMSGMNSKSDLDVPDVFKLFWKEEMLHRGKQAPDPTIVRPVAGIQFELSSFCAYNFTISQFKHLCYLCSIVNKILMWFESLLVFISPSPPKKTRPDISGIWVVKKTGFEKKKVLFHRV